MDVPSKRKVIACIIVRIKSKRLPNKALADINGKSMTQRIIERLRTAKTVDQIVICTSTHPDDQILIHLAKNEWDVEAFAGSELDVLSRLIHAADLYQADIVIRVTGDNPFTDAETIDRMVKHHIITNAEYTRTNGLPVGVTAEVMSRAMLSRLHELMPDPNQSEYLTLFAFDPAHFHCEILDAPPELNRPFYSLTIDTPADLELAQKLYNKLAPAGDNPSLIDIVGELDADPAYKGISKATPVKFPDGKIVTYMEALDRLYKLTEISRRHKV